MTRKTTTRIRLQFLAIALGIFVGVCLVTLAGKKLENEDPAQMGFAVNSRGISNDNYAGQFVDGSPETIAAVCTTGKRWQREGYRVVLWLGASQLYTLTNPRSRDHLAVYYANEEAEQKGYKLRFVQACDANATPHEQLILYLACRNQGFYPDYLMLGLFYKPLNEASIRSDILKLAQDLPPAEVTGLGETGRHIQEAINNSMAKTAEPVAATQIKTTTVGERIEAYLVDEVGAIWPVFGHRDQLRTTLEASAVREAAAWLFHFSEAKRPVVRITPEMERWNMTAFDAFIQVARQDGARLMVYKVPHQPGLTPFYYDRKEYDTFFTSIAGRCHQENIPYRDEELLVPQKFWGGYTQFHLPDVLHFQDEGHALLGKAISSFVHEYEAK